MNPIKNSKHIRCVLSNCKSDMVRDKNLLRLYTREFCKELRIGSICSSHFLYNPYGLTIVVLIDDGDIILKSIYESNTICIDIFTIFQYELCVVVFRTPVLESLYIQQIVRYDIYVYVDRGDLVLVFQVQGNEFIGSVDAVHEVRPSLDHTLVDQFLERLFLANDTQVE